MPRVSARDGTEAGSNSKLKLKLKGKNNGIFRSKCKYAEGGFSSTFIKRIRYNYTIT